LLSLFESIVPDDRCVSIFQELVKTIRLHLVPLISEAKLPAIRTALDDLPFLWKESDGFSNAANAAVVERVLDAERGVEGQVSKAIEEADDVVRAARACAERVDVGHPSGDPRGFCVKRLTDLPMLWSEQWRAIGLQEAGTVAGSRLRQMLFWVPQSGDIGMGVSILSYAGQVQFGLITDDALTPDPEAVVSRFSEEFEQLLRAARPAAIGIGRGAGGRGNGVSTPSPSVRGEGIGLAVRGGKNDPH
jgi:WS/DGAT C-terminal domain